MGVEEIKREREYQNFRGKERKRACAAGTLESVNPGRETEDPPQGWGPGSCTKGTVRMHTAEVGTSTQGS